MRRRSLRSRPGSRKNRRRAEKGDCEVGSDSLEEESSAGWTVKRSESLSSLNDNLTTTLNKNVEWLRTQIVECCDSAVLRSFGADSLFGEKLPANSISKHLIDPTNNDTTSLFHFTPSHHLTDTSNNHMDLLLEKDLDYFKVFFGPASGPRSFVTSGFEQRLKTMVQEERLSGEKWLVGGSTGALRFMAFLTSLTDESDATKSLLDQYCHMYYKPGDTCATLRPFMEKCFSISAPSHTIDDILSHPQIRIAIIVGKFHQPIQFQYYPEFVLKLWLGFIMLLNFISPWFLPLFVTRLCFYSGSEAPTFLVHGTKHGQDKTQFHKLTKDNVHQVLHATTCIPFVSELCTHINGLGDGMYIDGGICDFVLNTNLPSSSHPGLLLHDQIGDLKPTVLDCFVPWRNTPRHLFQHCSVLHPSKHFVEALPERKLPNVTDWFDEKYIKDPTLRHKNWMRVYHLSQEAFDMHLWSTNESA
ncbi:hypothetical protein BCR33DRAFT_720005 [Rhizoclosmatium globosum]|uniref:FabD/lysophospholipase-like protein n=1 Tax=Rhizoclosmatium globosum TaxID=329046 RepID=A0A1Y2BZQ5_9FUNG|nr:hypothetical protein BCR33DRAFT_720005 [Rhizoclosmatium globosum]|eukprot:ORY39545.1 hypothetical protein BCR33DRAFT_720005 [Rhizoclosmatium globosum]